MTDVWLRSLPWTLVGGTSLAIACQLAVAGERLARGTYVTTPRLYLLHAGLGLAATLLIGAGLFQTLHRVAGRTRRALGIAAMSFAALVVVDLAYSHVQHFYIGAVVWFEWSAIVSFGVLKVAMLAALAVAASTPWRRAWLPITLGLAGLLGAWVPMASASSASSFRAHVQLALVWDPLVSIVSSSVVLWLVAVAVRGTTAPAPAPDAAARWLRRASGSTLVAVLVAITIGVCLHVLPLSRERLDWGLSYGPLAVTAALACVALSMLGAAAHGAHALPPLRLVVSATAIATAAGLAWSRHQWLHANWLRADLFELWRDHDLSNFEAWKTAWSIAGPALQLVGFLLVVSAIATFAVRSVNRALRRTAFGGGIALVVLCVASAVARVSIEHLQRVPDSAPVQRSLELVSTATIAGALTVLAWLLHRAAAAVRALPRIPQARLSCSR